MTEAIVSDLDRRARRTRQAVFDAFVRLALSRRYTTIRTADLIEQAGIGRSTFYEHFRNKDDVLIGALEPLFAPLANAGAGHGNRFAVQAVLEHLWDQRALARLMFEPALLPKLQRKLAGMIEARMADDATDAVPKLMVAGGMAASQLAMLKLWLGGEIPCAVGALASHLSLARSAFASEGGNPAIAQSSFQQRS